MSMGMDMYDSEKYPTQLGGELEGKKIVDFELGENISVFRTDQDKVYVAGIKMWWNPQQLKVPEGEELTGVFAGGSFAGYITNSANVYHVGTMFNKSYTSEIAELSLWMIKPEVFPPGQIRKIGGAGRNHYVVVDQDR